jgi:hypothetical protein
MYFGVFLFCEREESHLACCCSQLLFLLCISGLNNDFIFADITHTHNIITREFYCSQVHNSAVSDRSVMFRLMLWAMAVSACLLGINGILEEFVVRGPDDLNKLALDQLFSERRANPDKDNKDFASEESPLMQRAKSYAVNRGETRSDESLKVMVSQ